MTLSATTRSRIDSLRERYPHPRSAILPCLWAVQDEHGWLPPETMTEVAGMLALAPSEVQAVATFYSMYFTRPRGEHQVVVCVNAPCALRGAEDVVGYLERRLGVPSGGTTADGKFTWQSTIECLGACGYAPMMQVDHHFHENLTPDKIDSILERVGGDDGHAPPVAPPPKSPRRSRTSGPQAGEGAADGRDGGAAQ